MRGRTVCIVVVAAFGALLSLSGAVAAAPPDQAKPCAWLDPLAGSGTDTSRLREQQYGQDLSNYFDEQDDLHDFYSIAAQVIPALLVAMLFAESLAHIHTNVRLGFLAFFTTVSLVGEGFALHRVLGEGDDYPDLFLTIAGVAASAAGVLWVAVTRPLAELADRLYSGLGKAVHLGFPAVVVVFGFWAVGSVFPEYVSESSPSRPEELGEFGSPGATRFELQELIQAPQRRTLEAICERLDRSTLVRPDGGARSP